MRRVLAVAAALAALAIAGFLAVNLAALVAHGLGRADAGDVLWTIAGALLAAFLLRTARRLWPAPPPPGGGAGGLPPA